jgi:hypothetical protein
MGCCISKGVNYDVLAPPMSPQIKYNLKVHHQKIKDRKKKEKLQRKIYSHDAKMRKKDTKAMQKEQKRSQKG